MEGVVGNGNPFICFSCHHAVGSHPCKNVLKHISINNKILAGASVVRHILRKNIIFICTAVNLNTFLSAFYIILIIPVKCTSGNLGIFYSAELQKMRFQIIQECCVFDGDIGGMSDTESHKSTWFIFFCHALIIKIPGSTINDNISVAFIFPF